MRNVRGILEHRFMMNAKSGDFANVITVKKRTDVQKRIERQTKLESRLQKRILKNLEEMGEDSDSDEEF